MKVNTKRDGMGGWGWGWGWDGDPRYFFGMGKIWKNYQNGRLHVDNKPSLYFFPIDEVELYGGLTDVSLPHQSKEGTKGSSVPPFC